jgi:hypothetical protein
MLLKCQTAAADSPKPRAAMRIESSSLWAEMKYVGQAARILNTWYKEHLGPKQCKR